MGYCMVVWRHTSTRRTYEERMVKMPLTRYPYQSVMGVSSPTLQPCLPARNTLRYKIKTPLESISRAISHIPGITVDKRPDGSLVVYASQNTWSRAARRRALRGEEPAPLPFSARTPLIYGICFPEADGTAFEWIRGGDRGLFESFASHVMRSSSSGI